MQQIRQPACDNEQHDRDLMGSYSRGLIIRQKEPANLEAPFDRLNSYITADATPNSRQPIASTRAFP
jgi:hypothetical protein